MSNLDNARKKINEIDQQIASLFEERMHASKEIAEYKKENGLPIFDPVREKEVIDRNSNLIKDETLREYYIPFQKGLMEVSKDYQRRVISDMK